jgi:hypothetical protein
MRQFMVEILQVIYLKLKMSENHLAIEFDTFFI